MIRRTLLAAAVTMAALPALTADAQAPKRLSVDQNDPALEKFRAAPPQAKGRSKADSQVLKQLEGRNIPVLNFTTPPLAKAARGRSTARCKQAVVTDDDPGWYAIRHECGSTIITVIGDERVQAELQDAAPAGLAGKELRITPATGDVTDSGGLTAEMVLSRYPNIPYTVTVECTPANVSTCTTEAELRKIAESLGLVAVPPKK